MSISSQWRDKVPLFRITSRRQFLFAYWAIVVIMLVLIQPIKTHTWSTIRTLGDDALAARHFPEARLQYRKMQLINMQSSEPSQLIARVDMAESDIITLRPFYEQRGDHDQLELMNYALATYPEPHIATAMCQSLLQSAEHQLALVCIQRTTDAWPQYRDGWVTQSIIAGQMGKTELEQQARQKVLELDPAYGW